ncbi:beta-lactamase/transpeptidase-like protein [Microthyrium microscopicum]|uniref:Beta-lactamase/transpeptidase-like protein n=1 Tax=Microthyrium microscopicum TaxID=703497 RepID=A0A6A6U121_9PEZI|nr:beta-lactamase/transpeptidase-like protein [Microthyrium microscopicum]
MAEVEEDSSTKHAEAKEKNPLTKEFGTFVKETMEKWKVPGISLAVIDGENVYAEGYGYATLQGQISATAQTLWYCASTTKAHTAAALSEIIHSKSEPLLSKGWSTTIASIIPEDFVLQDEWATKHVTLDDAVGHRTGMTDQFNSTAREENGVRVTPKAVTRNLRNLPMVLEPRSTFHYCNFMYVVLSHILETVSGKSLEKVLKEHIWDPLDMKSTFLNLDEAKKADDHLADGYYWDKQNGEYRWVDFLEVEEISGAGGAFSTVLDYAKWVKCLLFETEPFSSEVHKDIKKSRSIVTTAPGGGIEVSLYSLGWQRTLYKGHLLYLHSGGMHAYGSQVYWLPDKKFGVVAFGNTAYTSNAVEDILAYQLMGDKLGIPQADRFDFDSSWEKRIDFATGQIEDPIKHAFPSCPETNIASTFKTSELIGSYSDPGYGTITLREESHPGKLEEMVLVADRPEMTYKYQLRLHHAFADYWAVAITTPWNPTLLNQCFPGEFKRGRDGRVAALEIEWVGHMGPLSEGTTTFSRVADEEAMKESYV